MAGQRRSQDFFGDKRQAVAITGDRLHARPRCLIRVCGRCLARGPGCRSTIELIRMQPDDASHAFPRQSLRFESNLDLQLLVVHRKEAAPQIVAVHGADKLRRRVVPMHARQRQQPLLLRFGDLSGRCIGDEFERLELVVSDEGGVRD